MRSPRSPSRSFRWRRSISWVFAARFIDRIGKGIRGAPRDALVAELSHRQTARRGLRAAPGARFGGRLDWPAAGGGAHDLVRQRHQGGDVDRGRAGIHRGGAARPVYVREPERAHAEAVAQVPLSVADARRLPLRYWLVVLLGGVFTLGALQRGVSGVARARTSDSSSATCRS